MNKKELALEVIERLKNEYPDADCTLEYDQAWKLLVSVRLAAQCTDARVNVVVKGLFEKYPTVEALADAPVEDTDIPEDPDPDPTVKLFLGRIHHKPSEAFSSLLTIMY